MTLETVLLAGYPALVTAVGALWFQLIRQGKTCEIERRDSAKLIFALLSRLSLYRGTTPPATVSTVENPILGEAQKLGEEALNGNIERLLKRYLESEPPKD